MGTSAQLNLNGQDNVVAYWGQGYNGDPPLQQVCSQAAYDVVILSFITVIGDYQTPQLTTDYFTPEDITYCQSQGKTILLSVGGGGYSVSFVSENDAFNASSQVWDLFLGGSSSSRPYGSVVFDGIDLDIESGAPHYWANFTTGLRNHYKTDPSRTYYLSSAPQCPFSDAQMGPDGTVWNGNPIQGSAITDGWFDWLNIQFYNNKQCEVLNKGFNLNTWSTALRHAGNPNMKVMVGLPGSPKAADSGYVAPSNLPISQFKSYSNFAGIMFWDCQAAQNNNNFQDQIAAVLNNN